MSPLELNKKQGVSQVADGLPYRCSSGSKQGKSMEIEAQWLHR